MTTPHRTELPANEHTFGREHLSPPPLEWEQGNGQWVAGVQPEEEVDWVQRIRNVGEW
ncbi:MAG: hypothetical protein RR283_05520 [Comamonas sp.]|uniref:hypothetical protein n=1 Tax=Comamonas aquatilis TaxID=1778406 RepID=UPI0039F1189A